MQHEIPESFFRGLADPTLPGAHSPLPGAALRPQPTAHMRALILYDAIIDDILANPAEAKITHTAKRLGKSPNTLSLVMKSDFFRARWLQRREQYNEDLNFRLQSKLAKVAEKSLDVTLKKLDEAGTKIPLPDLTDANKTLLDRLGYGPSPTGGPTVVVQQNNNQAPEGQATSDGLAAARKYLQLLEQQNAASGSRPGNTNSRGVSRDAPGLVGPVVEGEVATRNNEDVS